MKAKIGGYDRLTKHLCEHVEIVAIRWPPGTRTPKHNHHSHGEVEIFAGELFEIGPDGEVAIHTKGELLREVANGAGHIVGNRSNEEAITIHRYYAPGPHGLVMDVFEDSNADHAALRRLFSE